MQRGSGSPRDFWEREQGSALRSVAPAPGRTAPARGAPAPSRGRPPQSVTPAAPAAAPVPAGPPARVGGTVAALVVAVLTLLPPLLGAYLGVWFVLLGCNVPGIVLGVIALSKVPDADEVERYLRYTWACNLAYAALCVPVVLIVLFVLAMALVLGY